MRDNNNPVYTFIILGQEYKYQKDSNKHSVNFDVFFDGDEGKYLHFYAPEGTFNLRQEVCREEHQLLFDSLLSLMAQMGQDNIEPGTFAGGDLIVVKEGYIVKTTYSGSILLDSPQDVSGCRRTTDRNGTSYYQAHIVKGTAFSEWYAVSEEVYDELLTMFNE